MFFFELNLRDYFKLQLTSKEVKRNVFKEDTTSTSLFELILLILSLCGFKIFI